MPSDLDNSVPSATALTFEEWADSASPHLRHYGPRSAARAGWDARQPEIDALRERERRLREYAQMALDHWGDLDCAECKEIKDGLAELLAAKEGA